jgi:hypothetical protein
MGTDEPGDQSPWMWFPVVTKSTAAGIASTATIRRNRTNRSICKASSCAVIDKDCMIGAHLGDDQAVDRQKTGNSRPDPRATCWRCQAGGRPPDDPRGASFSLGGFVLLRCLNKARW